MRPRPRGRISGERLSLHREFPQNAVLDNRNCIPLHRVDLPMSEAGPLGKNEGGAVADILET
jgi:hypothetical protein